ncbi:MAG: multiheme c-type cytochrome [Desulfuromonadales bacterium]
MEVSRQLLAGLLFGFLCLMPIPSLALGATQVTENSTPQQNIIKELPEYVGLQACRNCHKEEVRRWTGSHHALAMQEATEETVLGRFDGRTFRYGSVTSTFFKRDNDFMVRTDGPDGNLQDFVIKYTFGVTPLQQYLVEFPGGRLQALGVAWDSRPANQGGQRWFHLYPERTIEHGDELHWTSWRQTWNFMCAECHSTHLNKNYDPVQHRYDTTWSEINVSCEACHGPASEHVLWGSRAEGWQAIDAAGNKGLTHLLDERQGVSWVFDSASGEPKPSRQRKTGKEIQVCAACHSRRAQMFEDDRHGQPFMESFLPALLEEDLYFVDGQIKDEVYVYGSFLQSHMFNAGVTCSNCHDPHDLTLRKPGNDLCLQCHARDPYQTAKHHFHKPKSEGSQCVNCHMPARLYMVVDPRRDHSFRVPRPGLSLELNTPNACNGCHSEQTAEWAEEKVRQWYGPPSSGGQNYAEVFATARSGAQQSEEKLTALLDSHNEPAIVRATAARLLAPFLSPNSIGSIALALQDHDPLVRYGAASSLRSLPATVRWQLLEPLLQDPVRTLRMQAADMLADVSPSQLPAAKRTVFNAAAEEFNTSLNFNADEPGTQVMAGNYYLSQDKPERAESAYREALFLDPHWVPAYVNLADLFRQQGKESAAEKTLRSGIAQMPQEAVLFYSLGLLQIRHQDMTKALESLKKATDLAPNHARYAYVYAVALDNNGETQEALFFLDQFLFENPDNQPLNELRLQLISKGKSP